MNLAKLTAGKNPPQDVYVVIEIPKDSFVKYELDKESGAVFVDRVLFTPMRYPFNYGFIPKTLDEDGDPIDVLVIADIPFIPGSVIRAVPIGMLDFEDESGGDAKIIAVPHKKVYAAYSEITNVDQLPQSFKDQIKHFFEHYKDLEPGKWVKAKEWYGPQEAMERIQAAVERYAKN